MDAWFNLSLAPRSPYISNRAAMARTFTVLSQHPESKQQFVDNRKMVDPAFCCGMDAILVCVEHIKEVHRVDTKEVLDYCLSVSKEEAEQVADIRPKAFKKLQREISFRLKDTCNGLCREDGAT